MPTLVIKDVPVELHRRLKEEAEKAHRSMNGEAIYLLEAGLSENQSVSAVHELPVPYRGKEPLTNKMINQWKRSTGLSMIDPENKPRFGWTELFKKMAQRGDDKLLDNGGPETIWSREEWEW